MPCDTYMKHDARTLLANKRILICGSSNMRGLYKDLVWLLEQGTLITQSALQRKNEVSYCGDERLSNGPLRNSRNYEEVRHYKGSYNYFSRVNNIDIRYQFITRLNLPAFRATLRGMVSEPPDVLLINSTLWDISRWGYDGVDQFKMNLDKTVKLIHEVKPPNCLVIWKTALPPSFKCRGGLITPAIQHLRTLLPFHILEANKWAAERMRRAGFDVLDMHYSMRFMHEYRCDDGIHFRPQATRYMINMFLTHLALNWNRELPGNYPIDEVAILRTGNIINANNVFSGHEPVPSISSVALNVCKVPANILLKAPSPFKQGKRYHDKQPKRLQPRNYRRAFEEVNNSTSPKWFHNNNEQNHKNRNQNHNYSRQMNNNRWQDCPWN